MVTTTHECHAPTYVCHVACGVQLQLQLQLQLQSQDPRSRCPHTAYNIPHRQSSPLSSSWPKRRIPVHHVAMLKLRFLPRRCQLNCKTPLQPQLKFFGWSVVGDPKRGIHIGSSGIQLGDAGGFSSLSQKLHWSLTYEMRGFAVVSYLYAGLGLLIRFTLQQLLWATWIMISGWIEDF